MSKQPSAFSSALANAPPKLFSAYCIAAAFTTYFCMYAFRKPFTAGTFDDLSWWNVGFKTILVSAQVMGYTVSKFIGIKVISEMPSNRRALSILGLIGFAEACLLLFAVVPTAWKPLMLFLNGLPLGMVFGLVLAYLEGRRVTEALSAGLCASFIVSSGVVKSVGRSLVVDSGVSEYWMPFLTGLLFVLPLLVGVWMLAQIPKPSEEDVAHRSERVPMMRSDRNALLKRHWFGLTGLVLTYILLTIIRSVRDDFGVEIWQGLGFSDEPSIYARSELVVMFGVVIINGAAVLVACNRKAFLGSLWLITGGFVLVLASLFLHLQGMLPPFAFMVLIGLGMYVPYVAFHTTVFERMIAVFRERGNIGYLMYLADATGYLGYVAVMVLRNVTTDKVNFLQLFVRSSLIISVAALVLTTAVTIYYARRIPAAAAATTLAPQTTT